MLRDALDERVVMGRGLMLGAETGEQIGEVFLALPAEHLELTSEAVAGTVLR